MIKQKFSICKECQQQYQKKSNSQFFCSNECKKKWWKKNPKKVIYLFYKKCKNCNNNFETNFENQKFCSNDCCNKFNGKIGKIGGDLVSLEKFILRYGNDEGTIKYNEYLRKKSACLKEYYITHSGPMTGKHHSDESKRKVSENNFENYQRRRGKPLPEITRNKISTTTKGWIFTLKWFIEKYGKQKGIKKYNKRIKHISKISYLRIYNSKENKQNYSNISQKLFWQIYNNMSELKSEKVYFAQLNHEFSCGISHCNFDFVAKNRKKIIEFNGDKFHANPNIYKAEDFSNPFCKKLSAKEIWDLDKMKQNLAILKGYQILIVWHSEYEKDKQSILQKCFDFLKGD
jgi:hypothetical protein